MKRIYNRWFTKKCSKTSFMMGSSHVGTFGYQSHEQILLNCFEMLGLNEGEFM